MSDKNDYLTIEEAIALVVGLDRDLVSEVSLEDMLEAFIESAKTDYEMAESEDDESLKLTKLRVNQRRAEFAKTIGTCLRTEIQMIDVGQESDLFVTEKNNQTLVEFKSLDYWASINFGIDINKINYQTLTAENSKNIKWSELKLSLRGNKTIQLIHQGKLIKTQSLMEMKLQGIKKNEPNHLYGILLVLSRGSKYPKKTGTSTGSTRKNISQLSKILNGFAGLVERPFHEYTPDHGYRPKFKITDDTKAADKRAEEKAIHVPLDDNSDYSYQSSEHPDDADRFIQGIEYPK